ncbi:cell division protein FtsQ/DivIB [Sphingomonas morindae]|uniref:Cell division protein FtsQ n=1 Tax=Sphingomonas morindae TaxID=1541170 RepID=A0ABY4X9N2_9SPHN|nr:cell division protein FtsQ/DivIB [Sphingomonas morindae]USI73629.1 cell division protein FtsQ/DivIB [Sphingomonas morindae]
MSERAKIRRGATPRGVKAPAIARRGASAAKATRKAVASRAVATLPIPAERLERWWRRTVLALGAIGIAGIAWALGVPALVGTELGELAGAAGLSVKRVEIQGIHHMDRLPVYSVALDQTSTAMPLVDLAEIRAKLLKFGWVADARVSRRLPDTLLVDIVEREPAAIWQTNGRLSLIDRSGVVLAPVQPQAMPDLPVIVGPGANFQTQDLAQLFAAAPRLKPLIAGATWVGGRRWDMRFQSGETLALPEGAEAERQALAKFDRMDQAARLLGQGFVRFDMRVPGKFVVRVSREPGADAGAAPLVPPAPAGTDAI